MLREQELQEIMKRFAAADMDEPLCIEGEHLNGVDEGAPISLGWNVFREEKLSDDSEKVRVSYANNTTFEIASFLAHLPVDMPKMARSLELFFNLLQGVLDGNDADIEHARFLLNYAKKIKLDAS